MDSEVPSARIWQGAIVGHRAQNLANWSERARAHAASEDCGGRALIHEPSALSDVVRFDRARLGDISGLRVLHLQCHIGTDTVSLARLGGLVTGLDFSASAIAEARMLAEACGENVTFVEADAYDAAAVLGSAQFDLVYTGIGALCWLPRIAPWAAVIADLLVPGGRLFLREGHPMLWSIDERITDRIVVDYPYFEIPEPVTVDEVNSYIPIDAPLNASVSHSWNHGLGDIVSALAGAGLALNSLIEHDSVPWNALPGQMVVDDAGEWRLKERRERLPLTYTLTATNQPWDRPRERRWPPDSAPR